MKNLLVKGGLAALPGETEPRLMDIRIKGGSIKELAPMLRPEEGEEILDAAGMEVFPGAIDPHVHFDEPGFTHREDFFHGTSAAARGGVSTVIDMPCTSLPPVTSRARLDKKLSAMGRQAVVDYALFGGLSGLSIDEALAMDMEELAPEVVGFKCYFVSAMDTFTALNHYDFKRAVKRAAELGRPLLLHAEDASYVKAAEKAMKARSLEAGRAASWDDYADSRPEDAEKLAVMAAVILAGPYADSLHIVHAGTSEAAKLAAAAGASCETCPHYLAFSRDDFAQKGSALKTAPPVKSRGEADKLWTLLADGSISFAASDHAPAPEQEKHTGSVWSDYGGIPGTGTLFPYLYSEGYKKGRLDLATFLSVTSGAAAKRYGLSGRKAAIKPGMDADLMFMDPAGSYTVKGGELLSKGNITPFNGMELKGSVRLTLVRGATIWDAEEARKAGRAEAGILANPGYGKQLKWGY